MARDVVGVPRCPRAGGHAWWKSSCRASDETSSPQSLLPQTQLSSSTPQPQPQELNSPTSISNAHRARDRSNTKPVALKSRSDSSRLICGHRPRRADQNAGEHRCNSEISYPPSGQCPVDPIVRKNLVLRRFPTATYSSSSHSFTELHLASGPVTVPGQNFQDCPLQRRTCGASVHQHW